MYIYIIIYIFSVQILFTEPSPSVTCNNNADEQLQYTHWHAGTTCTWCTLQLHNFDVDSPPVKGPDQWVAPSTFPGKTSSITTYHHVCSLMGALLHDVHPKKICKTHSLASLAHRMQGRISEIEVGGRVAISIQLKYIDESNHISLASASPEIEVN